MSNIWSVGQSDPSSKNKPNVFFKKRIKFVIFFLKDSVPNFNTLGQNDRS